MFKKNSVILFQGDSITDADRSKNDNLNNALGNGYVNIIVSRLKNDLPDLNLSFINRGCSGDRIDDLYSRWEEDTLNLKPDIISILIGVNDVSAVFSENKDISAGLYEKIYRQILEDTLNALPDIYFILCDPFILPVGEIKEQWKEWKMEIYKRREIVCRIANEFNAVHVKYQEVFDEALKHANPEYWLGDGIHPSPDANELLARAWIHAVKESRN